MKNLGYVTLTFCLTLAAACSGTSSTTSATTPSPSASPAVTAGTLAISAFDEIVEITAPVKEFPVTDTSTKAVAAVSFDSLAVNTSLSLTATDGISLGASTSEIGQLFDNAANGSRAYCDTVNSAMKFFKEVSAPDFQLCLIKTMAKKAKSLPTAEKATIWDAKMSMGSMKMTYRFKFSMATAGEKLTKFESFTCSGMNGSLTQSGYTKETIADGKVSILARSSSAEQSNFKGKVTMESSLNDDGHPVGLKEIDYAEADDDRSVHGKVVQSSDNIRYIGYENAGKLTQYYSFAELIDKNAAADSIYAVTSLAYGDGAALVRVTESGGTPVSHTEGWDGATYSKTSSEPRIAKVTGKEAELLSPTGDSLDLSYTNEQTYDCKGTADETFESSGSDASNECMAAFDIDQEGRDLCTNLSY